MHKSSNFGSVEVLAYTGLQVTLLCIRYLIKLCNHIHLAHHDGQTFRLAGLVSGPDLS